MMAKISDLAPIAEQVNKKSNEINNTISTINAKLAKLNFGIEVWLDETWNALSSSTRDYKGFPRTTEASYLGYCLLDDKWQLAIKNVEEETTVEDGEECTKEVNPDYVSLHQASRGLRLAALQKLPELLDALKGKASGVLKSIEEAEKLAESL
jgi:hypothetical protein